jgi:hypothetical protein
LTAGKKNEKSMLPAVPVKSEASVQAGNKKEDTGAETDGILEVWFIISNGSAPPRHVKRKKRKEEWGLHDDLLRRTVLRVPGPNPGESNIGDERLE